MKQETINFKGEYVCLSPVQKSNLESYLEIYKRASAYSIAYEKMPELWDDVKKSIVQEVDEKQKYIIKELKSNFACGFIVIEYDDENNPEIDIAILPEYRRKGYGYDASRILCNDIFKDHSVECIMWHAFQSNSASCRIAEKLGGEIVVGKNLFVDAMISAGFDKNSSEFKDALKTITYEIKRMQRS